MKIIERTAHVVVKNEEGDKFIDGVTKCIKEFQKEGLEVETQYQKTPFSFSALILGYKFIDSAHDTTSRGNATASKLSSLSPKDMRESMEFRTKSRDRD